MHKAIRWGKKGVMIAAGILAAPLVNNAIVATIFAVVNAFPILKPAFSPLLMPLWLIGTAPSYWLLDTGKIAFYGYFVITKILLLFSLGIIIISKKTKVFKNLLFYYLLIGLSVLIYTYISLWSHRGVYYPARSAKPGVIYDVIGLPENWYDNLYKYLCIRLECKAEKYEILGWESSEVLVYKKWENWNYGLHGQVLYLTPEKKFHFNTVTKKSGTYNNPLPILTVNTCDSKICLAELMEDAISPMYECTTAYVSPDKNKYACIAKHLYGPQDIMIFEK